MRAGDDKLKEDKFVEKAKASARQSCQRLGKFTMPFAWTAIVLDDAVACCRGDLLPSIELEIFQQVFDKLKEDDLFKVKWEEKQLKKSQKNQRSRIFTFLSSPARSWATC